VTEKSVTEKSVTEKPPQRAKRWPASLLFMRLATSLAAIAFVVTAGLTFVQRSITPTMMTEAPKAAEEMPVLEAPRAVVATVEVSEEAEVMLASESVEMPEEPVADEEVVQAEKAVESEEGVKALAPAPPAATPQPDAGGVDETAAINAQEREEAAPQVEVLALEPAPAAEAQVADEVERTAEDSAGTLSASGEGEWMAYDTAESGVEVSHEPGTVRQLQRPSWWLPTILGMVTLLLAGITYWVSRRR